MNNLGYKNQRKYQPNPDPLERESKLNDMIPLPGWAAKKKEEALSNAMQIEIRAAGGDQSKIQAINNAYAIRKAQIKEEVIDKDVNKMFVEEFNSWLLGKSKLNTPVNNTPWGTQRLTGSSIRQYLNSFVDKKIEFQRKLARLKLFPPQTIGEAWLFFKYIVCKKEPLDEDYLEDFNYWTNPHYFQGDDPRNVTDRNPLTGQPYALQANRNAIGDDNTPHPVPNAITAGDPGSSAVASRANPPLFDAGACVDTETGQVQGALNNPDPGQQPNQGSAQDLQSAQNQQQQGPPAPVIGDPGVQQLLTALGNLNMNIQNMGKFCCFLSCEFFSY